MTTSGLLSNNPHATEQGACSNVSSSHVIIHLASLPTNTIKSISMFTGQCGCVWVWRANQRGNADKEKSKAELHQSNRVPIHTQQISWRQFHCNGLVDEIPNPVPLLFFFYRNPLFVSYIHIYFITLLVASAALSWLCHSSWQEQTGMLWLVQACHNISALNEPCVLWSAASLTSQRNSP